MTLFGVTTDVLRPPWPNDASASAYKDWLHLNVFDHASGSVGLFNVSLHGAPANERSRAIGVALVHVPGEGWLGNVEVAPLARAGIGMSSVSLERVALATDPRDGSLRVSVRMPEDGLRVSLQANPAARPLDVAGIFPFGRGWISWFVVPRMSLSGSAQAGPAALDLAGASAYHDHNWGRWHWGDDVAWDWGVFAAPGPGPTLVLSRATDRERRRPGAWFLGVSAGATRRVFPAHAVSVAASGRLCGRLRRLPGALAALHGDRVAPRLPEALHVRAHDGIDHLEVEFRARAAAQIIAADPMRPGYGFIHESAGTFSAHGVLAGAAFATEGLGIVESVT